MVRKFDRVLLLVLFWGIAMPVCSRGQNPANLPESVTGRVLDAETGLPIPGAQVFYGGTMIGDITDLDGYYVLKLPPVSTISLVVSMLGYEYATVRLNMDSFDFSPLNFRLSPRVLDLDEVTITAERDDTWRGNVKRFEEVFFSHTQFGKSCRLINPEVLSMSYDEPTDRLLATAEAPLIVENRDLGYRVMFHNLSLDRHYATYRWTGEPLFESMEPKNGKEARKWEKNRREAFEGSLRHLLHALISGRLVEEGFEVYDVNEYNYLETKRPIVEMTRENADKYPYLPPIVAPTDKEGILLFQFPETLLVIYQKDNEPAAYVTDMTEASRTGPGYYRPYYHADTGISNFRAFGQTSWLKMSVPAVYVDTNANILYDTETYPIKLEGYLAWERVGELLPFDYVIRSDE